MKKSLLPGLILGTPLGAGASNAELPICIAT